MPFSENSLSIKATNYELIGHFSAVIFICRCFYGKFFKHLPLTKGWRRQGNGRR